MYTASSNPNKPKPVTVSLKKGESAAEVNSDNDSARPHRILIDSNTKPATLHLACATAGATIHYSLTETAGGVPPVSMTGSGSGFDLELPIPEGRTEADYKLEVRAEAAGFTPGGTRTLYYKVTAKEAATDLSVLRLNQTVPAMFSYAITLSKDKTAYECYIAYEAAISEKKFTLEAQALSSKARITEVKVDGAVQSITAGQSVTVTDCIRLSSASNDKKELTIIVTGEDASITKTYTVTGGYAPVLNDLTFKQGSNPIVFRNEGDDANVNFSSGINTYYLFVDQLTPNELQFTYDVASDVTVAAVLNEGGRPIRCLFRRLEKQRL